MQNKVVLINSFQQWNSKKRYKINEVVTLSGNYYQNTTGINTNPSLGVDWRLVVVDYVSENTDNKKTTISGNETSDVYFGTIKALITYLKEGFIGLLPAKATALVDGDYIVIGDSEDANKTKTRTFAQLKTTLKTYFDTLYQAVLVSGTNIKTLGGIDVVGSGDIPGQITITTSTSITTATTDAGGKLQNCKNVIIDNGVNVINITVNGVGANPVTYQKEGTGAITFVQGSGRTLRQVDGTNILNGAVGSTAVITSFGTVDSLRISNA